MTSDKCHARIETAMKDYDKVLYTPSDWEVLFNHAGVDCHQIDDMYSWADQVRWPKNDKKDISFSTAVIIVVSSLWKKIV